MHSEDVVPLLVSVVAGLVSFPVIMFLSAAGLFQVGLGPVLATAVGAVVGVAGFVLIVWKSGRVLRGFLGFIRSRLPEPLHTCIEFGGIGAFVVGSLMLAVILLLGHARPQGWEISGVLPAAGVGCGTGVALGFLVGLDRRRRRRP